MEWLAIGVFFAACAVLNRWAFQKDVERAIRWRLSETGRGMLEDIKTVEKRNG